MAESAGLYLAIDHPRSGTGFAVDLCGRAQGRIITVACRPTHVEAVQAAAKEAAQRGLEVEDRTTGAA